MATSSSNSIALATAPSPTIPLLTRFTVPSDCSTKWYSVDYPYTNSPAAFATAYMSVIGKGCALETIYESQVDRTSTTQKPVVYSPGVCPDSYLPVSTITVGPFQGVNTSICCFEGLSYISTGLHNGNCGGTVTSTSKTLSNYPDPHHTGPNQTVVNSFYFLDLAYTVAWATNQLDQFTPASLPLLIASEARAKGVPSSASALPSASRTGSSDASSNGNSKDLSVGAQAGIGVAAAVVGVAIGAFITWYFIRRRSRRQAQTQLSKIEGQEEKRADIPSIPSIPELGTKEPSVEVPVKERPQEMFVEAGHEVEPDRGASEADNNDMRHELDAGYRGEQMDDITTPIDDTPPQYTKDQKD